MKLAAIAKLIKADGYCKLYKVFYDDCRTYDLYIGTKTAIFPLTGFPKAQNESELATLLGISKKEWADIEFDNDCPDDLHHIEGMGTDGMPRGGTPGDSTAAMACRMDELGIGDQLRQLEQQRAVLLGDQRIIQGQMNRLDSGHNMILTEFYISHKKWHEVKQKVPYSVQHLKYLRNVALAQLGRNLERLPECAALLSRALNTREEQRRADAWAEGDILL